MIDSHVHLNDERFDYDRDLLINSLYDNGIERVYNIGADLESSIASVELSNIYENIKAVIGIHPHDAESYNEEVEKKLIELAENKNVRAIGEIGLDYYYDNSPRDIQIEVFKKQIELANKLNLPIVIHSREAAKDTFEIIKEYKEKYPNLVFLIHCYSQSVELMKEYMKLGCYIGIGGVLTFKNAKVIKDVVKEAPMDRILLETDCPYLAPVPFRGKRNEPMYVKYVAKEIAKIKNMNIKEVEDITTQNTLRFYND